MVYFWMCVDLVFNLYVIDDVKIEERISLFYWLEFEKIVLFNLLVSLCFVRNVEENFVKELEEVLKKEWVVWVVVCVELDKERSVVVLVVDEVMVMIYRL